MRPILHQTNMKVNKQKAETRGLGHGMGTRVLPLIMGARQKNCRSECEFLRSPKNFPHTQQSWVCGRLMAVGHAAISEHVHDRVHVRKPGLCNNL